MYKVDKNRPSAQVQEGVVKETALSLYWEKPIKRARLSAGVAIGKRDFNFKSISLLSHCFLSLLLLFYAQRGRN